MTESIALVRIDPRETRGESGENDHHITVLIPGRWMVLGVGRAGVAHYVSAPAALPGWVQLACTSLAFGSAGTENELSERCPACVVARGQG